MRDSDTYMAILDEGREEGREEGRLDEVKKMIVRLGQKSLGTPDENVKTTLEAITDLDHLEALVDRIAEVKSWQELLATS